MRARFVGSGAWVSVVTRRRLRVAAVLVFVAGAIVLLALWATPPVWLAGPQRVTLAGLRWVREHVLTVEAAGVLVGIAGLVVPFLVRRLERRDDVEGPRRARNRPVMLRRVRHRWITGVLEQSLTEEARIRLGLTRHLDVIQRPAMTIRQPGGQSEPLPAGTSVSEVFNEIGGGLLILGAPGSGKTTGLLELARDLLKDAEKDQGQPMPVVFNLSSWAVRRPPLAGWLVDELHTRYDVPRSIAQRWVDGGEVLPLLDGLDEVATAHRGGCVEAINVFHRERGPVRFAVCCRTEEYTAVARLLQVEEALEFQPPTREQVTAYLAETGGALADVQAALEADETLWEFLQSPLVLSIVALTYQDRSADALRTTGTPGQRLALLFTAYIERMLEHRHGRYSEARMLRWLGCLARSMRQRDESEFYIDRLEPDWLPTKAQQRLATLAPMVSAGLSIGLVPGLVAGLLGGSVFGLAVGLVTELVFAFGLATGLTGDLRKRKLVEQVRWSWDRRNVLKGGRLGALRGGVLGALGSGLGFGLLSWLRGELSVELPGGLGLAGALLSRLVGSLSGLVGVLVGALVFGLVSGLVGALIYAFLYSLHDGLADERSTPNEGIHRSARYACVYGLGFGLVFGLADGLIVGLSVGLTVALAFGWLACLQHLVIRALLVRSGVVPWRYVDFLDEAKDRLFLRRTGSGYIFVHRLLLEHFAGLDTADRAELPVTLAGVGLPDGSRGAA